jgi:endonuclease/exonuclease/phosphatase family metal-dependent hydrolase
VAGARVSNARDSELEASLAAQYLLSIDALVSHRGSEARPLSQSAPPARRKPRALRRLARLLLGIVVILLALGLAISARTPRTFPPRPAPGSLRIATYNIRAGLGSLEGIAQDLRALGADVIALQEVERSVQRSRGIDQARVLADSLGFEHAFAGSFSLQTGEHGIAILSRFPLRDPRVIRLPQGEGRWPRSALTARIESDTGPFLMVCVHLTRPWSWPLSHTRARVAQIRTLLTALADEELPIVIAGDFNCLPVSPEVMLVRRHFASAWRPWRDGWGTSFPLRAIGLPFGAVKIDHVFHDSSWEDRGFWVAPRGASDHRPVLADLRLRATRERERISLGDSRRER